MVEYGHKLEGKMKAILSEIKENVREPTVKGRKLRLKSMVWSRRKKETFNQNRMKKQKFKKMRREPWLVWLNGLSAGLQIKGSLVQSPARPQAWAVGQVSSGGAHERQPPIDVPLPLFLPPFPSV